MEERTAVITDVTNSQMRDTESSAIIDYTNPAGVQITVGDNASYIRIVAGNGKEINIIKKKL